MIFTADKKYYWLKLKENFFDDLEIKKLRRIAGGDTYTCIYLKMLLRAMKNDCKLLFKGIEDNFVDELALELDEDADNVRVTVSYLLQKGLLQELNENEMLLTKLPECIGSETEKAQLMRNLRGNKKVTSGNNVTAMLPQRYQDAEQCYTEIEKEKENKREEIDNKRESIDYQLIADMYNNTCVSFPRLKALSESRKKAIRARIKSGFTVNDFQELFDRAEQSSFLKGKNNRNWSATFDWIIKDSNAVKILDGNYTDKPSGEVFRDYTTKEDEERMKVQIRKMMTLDVNDV